MVLMACRPDQNKNYQSYAVNHQALPLIELHQEELVLLLVQFLFLLLARMMLIVRVVMRVAERAVGVVMGTAKREDWAFHFGTLHQIIAIY